MFPILPLNYTAYMERFTLDWVAPPPVYIVASSSNEQVVLPAISLQLRNPFGDPVMSDNSTTCDLAAVLDDSDTSASSASVAVSTSGNISTVLHMGFVQFAPWYVRAALGSLLVLQVECARAEGGPTVFTSITVAVTNTNVSILSPHTLDPSGSEWVVHYDTPSPISVQLDHLVPDAATSSRVLSRRDWSTLSAPTTTCSLTIDAASAPIAARASLAGDISTYQNIQVNNTGSVTFHVRLQAQTGFTVPIQIECKQGDYALPTQYALASVTTTQVVMEVAPDAWMLPSTSARQFALRVAPVVSFRDQFGTLITDDAEASCTVAAVVQSATPGATPFASAVFGPSANGVLLTAGLASFEGVSVVAPLAANVTFTFSCARSALGAASADLEWLVRVSEATAFWDASSVASARNVLFKATNPVTMTISMRQFDGSGWSMQPLNASALGTSVCTMMLDNADAERNVLLVGGVSALAGEVNDAGQAGFVLSLQGPFNSVIRVAASCALFGSSVVSDYMPVTILQLVARFYQPPLAAWWPSSNSLRIPVEPFPEVEIVVQGGMPVEPNGLSCRVTFNTSSPAYAAIVHDSIAPRLIDPPEEGYSYNRFTRRVALSYVLPSGAWGRTLPLMVQCSRPENDDILPLSWSITMPELRFAWLLPPASVIESAAPFDASIRVTDRAGNLRSDDNYTSCTVSTSVFIQQSGATARQGVATFRGMAIIGYAASNYTLDVSCRIGDLQLPGAFQHPVSMKGCDPGYEPIGDGSVCSKCGDNAYTFGGAMKCIRCPYGVQCTNGVLTVQ
ncbi:MAG: hypothetical protein EOO65_02155, partial [Methanosarcinales archaeon]